MSVTPPPHFRVFLSEPALTGVKVFRDLILSYPSKDYERDIRFYEQTMEFIPVRLYEPFTVDDMTVSAVRGIHSGRFVNEIVLNYLFERNGRRFLYAADTGPYNEENYEFLKGKTLDILVTECSFGKSAPEKNHQTCDSIMQMVDRFRKDGVVSDRTEIWLTHIGHKGGLNHTELQQKMREMVGPQISVAYDGLRLAAF
jgi:phosphoribosyl 1,2-cyclic phosphate phosphodiesterase